MQPRGSTRLSSALHPANSETGQNVLYDLDFAMLGAQLGDFYEHTGWYFPVHPNLMREALEHVETNAPFDARHAVRLVGPASEHWPWIVEGLLASPSIQSRRTILDEAIFCMEHSRWHAAVSTLLPLIEGHVADHSGRIPGIRVRDRLDHLMYREPASSIKVLAAVSALEILNSEVFGPLKFGDPSQPADVLNRHWVLHGRTAGFGTPINACRTFMLFVALVELFDGALALRASFVPADAGALLDEHGPLAPLRVAAAQRCATTRSEAVALARAAPEGGAPFDASTGGETRIAHAGIAGSRRSGATLNFSCRIH